MNIYKVLNKQIFTFGPYTLVPIRFEDRYEIMKWRNEQIYHLRQIKPLTFEDQENYFKNIVLNLFVHEQPNQILFSLLEISKLARSIPNFCGEFFNSVVSREASFGPIPEIFEKVF